MKKYLIAMILGFGIILTISAQNTNTEISDSEILENDLQDKNEIQFAFDAGIKTIGLYIINSGYIYKTDLFAEYSGKVSEKGRIGFGAEISTTGGIGNGFTVFWGGAIYSVYEINDFKIKAGGFGVYDIFTENEFDYGPFLRCENNYDCFKKNNSKLSITIGAESFFPVSILYRDFIKTELFGNASSNGNVNYSGKITARETSGDSGDSGDSGTDSYGETEEQEECEIIDPEELPALCGDDSTFVSLFVALIPKFYIGLTYRF